ncbi:hypothetical protein F0562_001007 [Nyssa sinensis]|uniref:Protein kinase domain-containing protein n=1 Tax=Nyssa sinensis TaxID=561372 RepID=A0A5J5C1R1_9ASTE|nr:hypothetical protein F0562_001007 [Nyssa sinensis]
MSLICQSLWTGRRKDLSLMSRTKVADFWKEARILVTEYMVNGSLKQVLRKKDKPIDRRKRTIPWMAPELLNSKNMVTEKVDVYSFGIVMWELLTGEEPYANLRSEEIIAGIIKGDLQPEIPSWCDPAWRSLMERCWSANPDYSQKLQRSCVIRR